MGKLCRRLLTVTAALAFVCLLATEQVESTTGSFELRLHRFLNPGCCGGGGNSETRRPPAIASTTSSNTAITDDLSHSSEKEGGDCPPGKGCPVSFRICVKHYQASVDTSSPCIIGEFVTRTYNDQSLPKLNEAPPITFYLNFTWTGSFSFVIEAYHTEPSGERMLISRFAAQRSLTPKMEWTEDELTVNRTVITLSYRVRCQQNYFGHRCDILCKPRNDSFGHYTCRNDGQKVCMPGWEGDYCSTAVCRPGCHKVHGHCKQPLDCECRPGWNGELCDTCIRYPGCEHGTCDDAWQCNCNEGWGGLFCNQDLNYCTNHRPCKNGGTCTNTGQGSYTCTCSEEYMGVTCEMFRNPCQNYPCKNGGTCLNPSDGNHTCQCTFGFYGLNCETSANICSENPCKNGGSCIHDPGGFACACAPGFTGIHCEKAPPSCASDFCLNNGTCVRESSGPFCKCPSGFTGTRCEISSACKSGKNCSGQLSLCSSSPCKNGGLCRPELNDFICNCPRGYSGKLCEIFSAIDHHLSKNVPNMDQMNKLSTAISNANISHQVSDEPEEDEPSSHLAIVLSCTIVASTVFISCAICLAVKFCRRRRHEPKHYDEGREDEIKQNERNILRMNNKCTVSQQKKIVNILDHKVNNSAPDSKVVNAHVCSKKKLPEKNLLYVQRTLERREKNSSSGNSGCQSSQDWSPTNSGAAVFIIQDHVQQLSQKVDDCYQQKPLSLQMMEEDEFFATEV